MKKLSVVLFAILSLQSWGADKRCQSNRLCFFPKMPVLRQGDPSLLRHIAQNTRQDPSRYRDPGICSAVAGTMAVAAILNDKSPSTQNGSDLLSNFQRMGPYSATLNLGKQIGTDFKKGGTKNRDAFNGYKRFFKFYNYKSYKLDSDGVGYWDAINDRYDEYTTQSLINGFKSQKHILQANLESAKLKKKRILWKKISWYSPQDGHSVLVNGFDGPWLKIFDPWGAIYPVRLHVAKVKMNPLWSNKVTLAYVSGRPRTRGPAGFIGKNSNHRGSIVVMRGYIKIDAH